VHQAHTADIKKDAAAVAQRTHRLPGLCVNWPGPLTQQQCCHTLSFLCLSSKRTGGCSCIQFYARATRPIHGRVQKWAQCLELRCQSLYTTHVPLSQPSRQHPSAVRKVNGLTQPGHATICAATKAFVHLRQKHTCAAAVPADESCNRCRNAGCPDRLKQHTHNQHRPLHTEPRLVGPTAQHVSTAAPLPQIRQEVQTPQPAAAKV
jgi:hypothetical protein